MKPSSALCLAAAAALAGCGGPDLEPWLARAEYAAEAAPGGPVALRSHSETYVDLDGECVVRPAPELVVMVPAQFGELSLERIEETIVAPDEPCDGVVAPATRMVYMANSAGPVFDAVTYRALRGDALPDVDYTARIRLR